MIFYSDVPIVPLPVVHAVLIRAEKLIEFLFCHFLYRLTHPQKRYTTPYLILFPVGLGHYLLGHVRMVIHGLNLCVNAYERSLMHEA